MYVRALETLGLATVRKVAPRLNFDRTKLEADPAMFHLADVNSDSVVSGRRRQALIEIVAHFVDIDVDRDANIGCMS